MNKVIVRKYREDNTEWEEISLEIAIDKLSGYWNGDIEDMLFNEGLTLWTPFAEYKVVYKEDITK